jgi:hypothetical protein
MKKITLSTFILFLLCAAGCSDNNEAACSAPPTVSAGDDISLLDKTTVTLIGIISEGVGTWSIVEGTGGEIHSGTEIKFTGLLNITYKLKLESTNACGTGSDFLSVTFKEPDCRLHKIISDGIPSQVFNYNSDGLITSIDYTYSSINSTTLVEYDNSKKISKMISSPKRYSSFEYPDDRTILETIHTRSSTSVDYDAFVFRHEYDTEGLLLKTVNAANTNSYKRYEYNADKNLTKIYSTTSGAPGEKLIEETLSWDNKKNIDTHFSRVIQLSGGVTELYTTFFALSLKHNFLHVKQYDANGNVNEFHASYEYNSSNYPVKRGATTFELICE